MTDTISPAGSSSDAAFTYSATSRTSAAAVTSTSQMSDDETASSDETADAAAPASVAEVTGQLNQVMEVLHKGLRFQISDTTEELYVEVINKDTGKTLRTIPPEAVLKFKERFDKALGMILDSNA